jgi:hypothetical protein
MISLPVPLQVVWTVPQRAFSGPFSVTPQWPVDAVLFRSAHLVWDWTQLPDHAWRASGIQLRSNRCFGKEPGLACVVW